MFHSKEITQALSDIEKQAIGASEYSGQPVNLQEWVGWGRDEKSAKMRLMFYRVFTLNGRPLPKDLKNLPAISSRPLIETTCEESNVAWRYVAFSMTKP